jgi:sugar O-acyltransferase (sialic acid O-acetyltransferase NeuD family)
MPTFTPIHLPQSGPNDVTATIVEWTRPPGQQVQKGEVLGAAETTKSVFDLEAPAAGLFWPLAAVGAEVAVGAIVGALGAEQSTAEAARLWLVEQSEAAPGANTASHAAVAPADTAAAARTWTIKAELLAQRHNIDLGSVPAAGERITEADVQAVISARAAAGQAASPAAGRRTSPQRPGDAEIKDLVDDRYPPARSQRLLIIGGGNGAVQILDALARLPGQRAVGVVDDNTAIRGKSIAGVPVLGAIDVEWAADMAAAGLFDAAVISISTSISARARIFEQWKERGLRFANVIHPSSVVGMNVSWGEGNVVMAFCHFGACAAIGDSNFLSAFCSIEHHCTLGSHCSFGPAVVTSSRVQIGDRVRFGTGVYVEPGIRIGENSVIASGLALAQHIPANSLLKAHVGYSIRPRQPG